jgi:hypothetical protein
MAILKVRDNEGNIIELEVSKKGVNRIKKDIDSIEINDNGELVVRYTNGEESNLGVIVGVDGVTPFINADGNWQIGDTDTGVKAEGVDGTSGTSGIYVGSGEMPEDCNVQIDPDGETLDLSTLSKPTIEYIDESDITIDFFECLDREISYGQAITHIVVQGYSIPETPTTLKEGCISFYTGETTPTCVVTGPSSAMNWSGTDIVNNTFVPKANTRYTIAFWYKYMPGSPTRYDIVVRGVPA